MYSVSLPGDRETGLGDLKGCQGLHKTLLLASFTSVLIEDKQE